MRIKREDTIGLIIDYQERLVPVIKGNDILIKNTCLLINGLKILDIPMLVSQQYTKGLGMTVDEIQKEITPFSYLDKITFSCYEDKGIREEIERQNKKNIIICGIESHICVLQTVIDLLADGYNVIVVLDCIGSRKEGDREAALKRMEKEGALFTTYESILFELTYEAGNDTFKAISRLIK